MTSRYGIGPNVGNRFVGGGARAYEPGMPTAGGAAGRFNPYNYDNATLQQMVLEKPEMARFLPPDVWAGFGNEFFTQNPQFMNQLSRERIRGTGTWAGRNTGFASDIAEQYAPGRAGIGTPQPKEFLGGAAPMPYVGGGGSATTRRPISYEDLMRNPATLPGLKGTFGGTDLRSPQSPFPRISPQDYANLMPIERAQLGAGLKGAGINPEDYYAQTERLTQAPNLEGTRRMPNVGRYGRYGGY